MICGCTNHYYHVSPSDNHYVYMIYSHTCLVGLAVKKSRGRAENNQKHRRQLPSVPVSCLGALEISHMFCYSLTCYCLSVLRSSLKFGLKWLPFQFLIFRPVQRYNSSPPYVIARRLPWPTKDSPVNFLG